MSWHIVAVISITVVVMSYLFMGRVLKTFSFNFLTQTMVVVILTTYASYQSADFNYHLYPAAFLTIFMILVVSIVVPIVMKLSWELLKVVFRQLKKWTTSAPFESQDVNSK